MTYGARPSARTESGPSYFSANEQDEGRLRDNLITVREVETYPGQENRTYDS